ncbi:MAG: methylmalonyl-CoA mutase family protein [Nitrospinota bacterium]
MTGAGNGGAPPGKPSAEKKKRALREARTNSGKEIPVVYRPRPGSPEEARYRERLGDPGEYPYTRGIYPTMYRGELWTMRQYAGFSTPADTNARFKFLLQNGQTGLSMAYDLPTQLGLDSDDPRAGDDVGRLGVAVDTVEDMAGVFEGIPLGQVSVSHTINSTAPAVLAFWLAAADRQGVPRGALRGTFQNDILKEYIGRGTWIFPPRPSMRLVADVIEYNARHCPRVNAISVSATHIAETGATVAQDIAFPILNALAYIRELAARGLHVDEFVPSMSFHLSVGGGVGPFNLLESVAKLRAARRLWARLMKEKFGARNPKTMQLKFSTGNCGSRMAAREPLNNIVRQTLFTLAAVLGGTRSINMACYDEAFEIPSDESIRTALRIQQVVAHESGSADTVDPLAGSYAVEALTDQVEEEAAAIVADYESRGGIVPFIESGEIQRLLARQAYEHQRKIASGEQVWVGVNKYTSEEEDRAGAGMDLYEMDESTLPRQLERLRAVKARRDASAVGRVLGRLHQACEGRENVVPPLIEAAEARATVGEMTAVMREVFGTYVEPAVV